MPDPEPEPVPVLAAVQEPEVLDLARLLPVHPKEARPPRVVIGIIENPANHPPAEQDTHKLQRLLPGLPLWMITPDYWRVIYRTVMDSALPVIAEQIIKYKMDSVEIKLTLWSLPPSFQDEGLIVEPSLDLAEISNVMVAVKAFRLKVTAKVGIIGRTGARKSSILNAVFRLTPICGGCIFVDGAKIELVSVRDFRSRFAVVPQSPFLFQGSVRENLDPFGVNDDMNLWEVLEKCHIKEEIEAAGGLDIQLIDSESSFSVGQRQLLCLARAFLKSSKVLCLDECTANIDIPTALILQNVISTECYCYQYCSPNFNCAEHG